MPDVESLLRQMTLQEKVLMLAGSDFWRVAAIKRLGIPALKVTDGPAGARGGGNLTGGVKSTSFPAEIVLSSTWNTELVERIGQALAQETTDEEIWINAVAPSVLDTPANRVAMPDADPHRWVAPADLAEIIVFLASPANRVTRGAVIPVYGGS